MASRHQEPPGGGPIAQRGGSGLLAPTAPRGVRGRSEKRGVPDLLRVARRARDRAKEARILVSEIEDARQAMLVEDSLPEDS